MVIIVRIVIIVVSITTTILIDADAGREASLQARRQAAARGFDASTVSAIEGGPET